MDEQRNTSDDKLDETIDETFPASDSPANTVEVGIRVGTPPASGPKEREPKRPARPVERAR
jgi:hypothetical protein